MEKLNKINGLSFEPMEHRYFYNDVELKGITEIIKNYFFPNIYSAVPEDFLREKADYGSKVHSEIDAIISGFLDEPSTPEAKEFCKLYPGEYRSNLFSEYLVTDFKNYASQIDIVEVNDDGTADLIDIKTTSTVNKKYCSWQLSIYAFMFELCNPSIKVRNLYVLHLKNDIAKKVDIHRIDVGTIKRFLTAAANGNSFAEYEKVDADSLDEVLKLYKEIKAKETELHQQAEDAKENIFSLLREKELADYKNAIAKVVIVPEAKRITIDSKALKELRPEIYTQFAKESITKESLRISLIGD